MKKQTKPQLTTKVKQVLVFLVIIIALGLLVSAGTFTGAAMGFKCSDNDGGMDFDVKGSVSYNNRNYEDQCVGSHHLKERYCNSNWMLLTHHKCDNGCQDGACL